MQHVEHIPPGNAFVVAQRVDSIAWGLFFVWVGFALIANVTWGLGLLGVGIITMGTQVVRKYLGLAVQGFWVVVGVLFVLGGGWELLGVQFSLVPIVLIAAGAALLLSAVRKRSG